MSEPESPIIGIDLGTTNSVVAAFVDGRVQVLRDGDEAILPSVVGLDAEGQLLIGTPARNQQVAFPERTIASVKRKMGNDERFSLGDQSFAPQEISAMILRRLTEIAAKQLGCPVSRAVITVPAFFDENQRQATRQAGKLAGLTVERIINEPTAATLVYHSPEHERAHLVVYDFGGGTFDVSVVRMEQGVTEVLSSKGDTQLGGDDFDRLLMEYVAADFQTAHDVDLLEKKESRWRLLRACEEAKKELSDQATTRIVEEFIATKDGQPLNLDLEVTRGEYEELIASAVDRTVHCVDDALRDANLTIDQIDDLILVGGTTRTPLVQEQLRAEFGREPRWAVDPDLAVALGAATQAAMSSGYDVGPVLVDVTSRTLGVEVLDSQSMLREETVFSPIIHRNSPLPARHEDTYRTSYRGQERVEIHVLQGEHREINRNRSIGRFWLKGLSTDPDNDGTIIVRFELTLDGTLKVTAIEKATGKSESLDIHNALSQFHEEESEAASLRLDEMFGTSLGASLDEPSENPEIDATSRAVEPAEKPAEKPAAAASAEQAAEKSPAEDLLQRADRVSKDAGEEDAEEIAELASQLREAIEKQKESQIKQLCEELEDILFYVQS